MAFGSRKKQKKTPEKRAAKTSRSSVSSQDNPLYPPKKENSAAEVLTALATSAVCLVLVGVIFTKFSYAAQGYPSQGSGYTQEAEHYSEGDAQDTYEEQDSWQGTGTVIEDTAPEGAAGSPEDAYVDEGNSEAEAEAPAVTSAPTEIPTETPTPEPTATATPTPTASPTPEAVKDGPNDYIIPDSSSRYLTESDLKDLTQEQLLHARNEIYARHGRMFQSDELQAYFNSKSWYHGTIAPSEFDANASRYFNDYEAKNTVFILEYEKKKGYM